MLRWSYFFYLKHNDSETGFCLRLEVKPTQLGEIKLVSVCETLCLG
jgi:hypothetical protein